MRDDLLKQPGRKNGIPMCRQSTPTFRSAEKNKSLERLLAVIVLAVRILVSRLFTCANHTQKNACGLRANKRTLKKTRSYFARLSMNILC